MFEGSADVREVQLMFIHKETDSDILPWTKFRCMYRYIEDDLMATSGFGLLVLDKRANDTT